MTISFCTQCRDHHHHHIDVAVCDFDEHYADADTDHGGGDYLDDYLYFYN